jgi:hypothetical protein
MLFPTIGSLILSVLSLFHTTFIVLQLYIQRTPLNMLSKTMVDQLNLDSLMILHMVCPSVYIKWVCDRRIGYAFHTHCRNNNFQLATLCANKIASVYGDSELWNESQSFTLRLISEQIAKEDALFAHTMVHTADHNLLKWTVLFSSARRSLRTATYEGGMTLLHLLVIRQDCDIILGMVLSLKDLTTKNADGQTVLDIANEMRYSPKLENMYQFLNKELRMICAIQNL